MHGASVWLNSPVHFSDDSCLTHSFSESEPLQLKTEIRSNWGYAPSHSHIIIGPTNIFYGGTLSRHRQHPQLLPRLHWGREPLRQHSPQHKEFQSKCAPDWPLSPFLLRPSPPSREGSGEIRGNY